MHGSACRAIATVLVWTLVCSAITRAQPDGGSGGAPNSAPTAPTFLRVMDVVDPVGVRALPYFGWHTRDPDDGEIQTRYQVLVASSAAALTAEHGDVWDSGSVASSLQNHVPYAGPPLGADRTYHWKVRTWDRDGAASPYSEAARFVVGPLTNGDWAPAKWIKRNTTVADDYSYFRKKVTLANKTVARATAYISSVHKYALYVNGSLVGKGPSYHYPQYQYYNAYDITSQVRASTSNLFAIFNHWFGGGQGRPASSRGVIFKAVVEYTDGSKTLVTSDNGWRHSQAKAWVTGQASRNGEGVGYVERIDARQQSPSWAQPSFNDSSWTAPTVIGAPPVTPWTGLLSPDLSRIVETEIEPVQVSARGGGKYVVDLGKVYAGLPRITFSGGSSGTVVNMRGGYALNAAGDIDTGRSQGTNMSFVAVLNGQSFVYQPAEYLGMRYFQIDNAPMAVTTTNFKFVKRHVAMDAARSQFSSPNATLNGVWALMKHSLFVGAQEEFVDTPTREKGGFLGDAAIQSSVAMPVTGERVLTIKSLNEFIQSMSQHWSSSSNRGRMNAVYPNNDGARDIPDYTQAYLPWVWGYYLETGDRDFLSANYPRLKEIADYVQRSRSSATGLITDLPGGSGAYQGGIIDWPEAMRFGYDMTAAARTVINAWAYADYDTLANIAQQLGNSADEQLYRTRAEALKAAINARLLNAAGVYIDGLSSTGAQSAHVSQHANMFPLALGIVPSARLQQVIDKVKELKMSVGMVTVQWLVRALGEADQGAALIDLFTDSAAPGWARSLSRGATTTWESWTSDASSGQSQSHPWGAAGLHGYVRYILGVRPVAPQYERVRIQPLDFGAKLPAARGTVATDRGEIAVDWSRDAARFAITVELPTNVTASLVVPAGANPDTTVLVDGAALNGVRDGNYLVVGPLGSGNHTLERSLTAPPP